MGDVIDPDGIEDQGIILLRRPIGPVSTLAAVPSTYRRAVDAIADQFAQGPDHHDDGAFDDEITKDPPLAHLDSAGIWDSIWQWMFGNLHYERLLGTIDFQHGHDPTIQYWEDFLSSLAFQADLEKREELFMSIPLADHIHRLSTYGPRVTICADSSPRTSSSPDPVLSPPDGLEKLWVVNIVPRKFPYNTW
jgi:hypothetical protein